MNTQTKQYETIEKLKKLTQRKINLCDLWNGVIWELRDYVDWLDCTNQDIKKDPDEFLCVEKDMADDLKVLGAELKRIAIEYAKTQREYNELADNYYGTQQTTDI